MPTDSRVLSERKSVKVSCLVVNTSSLAAGADYSTRPRTPTRPCNSLPYFGGAVGATPNPRAHYAFLTKRTTRVNYRLCVRNLNVQVGSETGAEQPLNIT